MKKVSYCKKCLFPDTKPDLVFDGDGICDACRSAERKHGFNEKVDWDVRANEFNTLLARIRDIGAPLYDCVIPVSGGKDSTWQVYAAKILHKLRTLAVTFDQFDQTPTGVHNLNILRNIGVDHIHFSLNPLIVKKLVRNGFETIGDPYWVNHVGMFSVPFNVAKRFEVPLIIYGENPQFEYGGPEDSRDGMVMDKRWRQEFGGMRGFREEDMIDEADGISATDLAMLKFPDLEDGTNDLLAVFYGYFFKWDVAEHLPLIKTLGWKGLDNIPAGSWVDYENCDMQFIDIRERIKYLKYGYGRATDQLNIELRGGRIERAEALSLVTKLDGVVSEKNIQDFCDYLDISESSYNKIMDSFVNEDIFYRTDSGSWVLKNERK